MSNRSKLEFVKSIHRFAFLLFFDNVWSDSSFGVDSENSKRLIEALALHCRFSCAVSHLSGTIHTVDQMCPDLFTPWGWNVYFRHFNREQEEYRTREKKSYKNFWTKGKLKRLRQRWGSIFAYAPLCSLCQCTIVTSYFRHFVREDFQTWEGITTRQSCVLENKFEATMRAVSLLLLHCVLSASAQDQDGCEFLHIIIWNWMTHKLVAIVPLKYSNI